MAKQKMMVECAYCGRVSHTDIGLCISCGGSLSRGYKLNEQQALGKPVAKLAFLSGWPAVVVRVLCVLCFEAAGFIALLMLGAGDVVAVVIFGLLGLLSLYPFLYWAQNRRFKPYPNAGLAMPLLGLLLNLPAALAMLFAYTELLRNSAQARPDILYPGLFFVAVVLYYILLFLWRLVRLPAVKKNQPVPMKQALGVQQAPGPNPPTGVTCAYCGSKWALGTAFCPGCGAALQQPAPPAQTALPPARRRERQGETDDERLSLFDKILLPLAVLWVFGTGGVALDSLRGGDTALAVFAAVMLLPALLFLVYRIRAIAKR